MIDDDEDDRELFSEAIHQLSKTAICTTLAKADDALEKLKAKTIKPDVIFLDLNMPVMNGQQFLTEIKKHNGLHLIPVIIFSTSSHTGSVDELQKLGANNFITKPNEYNKLVQLLKSLIN